LIKSVWDTKPSWIATAVRFVLRIVGPVLNQFDWRFGRPQGTTDLDAAALLNSKPGSIVLTHTDYNLTNSLIPGYFDHAAMVLPGYRIIESTGKGVGFTNAKVLLSHCDSIAILEPVFANEELKLKACKIASEQDGAGYDYEFDFVLSNNKKFYCSELIWWSYDQACKPLMAPFTPRYVLGEWTLAPQNIYDDTTNFKLVYQSKSVKK